MEYLVFSLMLLISGTIITLGSPIKDDGMVRVEFTVGRLFLIEQPVSKIFSFLKFLSRWQFPSLCIHAHA